ncbi:transposase [Streptomyces sp. DH37]|uniref:transposase n=1 Tax=Streptomyces sp. DH37 TaxID=3040122 RepID=UPI0024435BDE|nr:transposase [Streptomyces sp. DH37]MDG9703322.1 transposase [Streptomyces sp. DH37]
MITSETSTSASTPTHTSGPTCEFKMKRSQWERERPWHSSDRITVEHALADHKRWKQLTRWAHRRDRLPDTYRAIAGLVSGRTTTI